MLKKDRKELESIPDEKLVQLYKEVEETVITFRNNDITVPAEVDWLFIVLPEILKERGLL